MKYITLLTLALLAACAAPPEPRLDPTQPYPDAGMGAPARVASEFGVLEVHSPRIEVTPDGRDFDDFYRGHWDATTFMVNSPYRVFDPEGRLVADVVNHSPLLVMTEGPVTVPLPPGRYLVELKRPRRGPRIFWVTIEAGTRTVIDPETTSYRGA